jgi:hypothetical protein
VEKTSLKIIPGSELPPQGWSSRYRTRLNRAVFLAPTRAEVGFAPRTQPLLGGLYTSSLIYHKGELLGTVWTENNPIGDRGELLYQVIAKPKAKIVVIDSRLDLFAAIDRWPHRDRSGLGGLLTVDWPAAARDVDGFWLTHNGNSENHGPHFHSPDLNTWDTEQVLWLRPAFVVGHRLTCVNQRRREELRAKIENHNAVSNREVFLDMLRDPTNGPGVREWIDGLNPVASRALSKLVGLDLSPDALAETLGLPSLL